MFISSCTDSQDDLDVDGDNQEQPEKLVVYLSGVPHGFQSREADPFGVLEYQIINSALQRTADKEMSCSEAGEWVVNVLEDYLEAREDLNPFYDSGLEIFINNYE